MHRLSIERTRANWIVSASSCRSRRVAMAAAAWAVSGAAGHRYAGDPFRSGRDGSAYHREPGPARPFHLEEATITEIQQAILGRKITATDSSRGISNASKHTTARA